MSTVNESRIAKAAAQIGNSKIRAMHLRSKFDRVTGTFLITTLAETQTFTGNNSLTRFDVKWPMDVRRNQVSITVDGIEELQGNYSVSNKEYTKTIKVNEDGTINLEVSPGGYIKIEKSAISMEWTANLNKVGTEKK